MTFAISVHQVSKETFPLICRARRPSLVGSAPSDFRMPGFAQESLVQTDTGYISSNAKFRQQEETSRGGLLNGGHI